MLFRFWKHFEKNDYRYHAKDIDMLRLGCTLPSLANKCLHKTTETRIHPFTEADKDCCRQVDKPLVVVILSLLHAKQLLTKLLIECLQTNAKHLKGLMLANQIPTRYVNPCPPVYIQVEIPNEKKVVSHFDKTRPVAFKIKSNLVFNEEDQTAKPRASIQQADRKKDSFSMKGFRSHCNTATEAMDKFCQFCPEQKVRPSLTEENIRSGSQRRKLDKLRRIINKKRLQFP